MIVRRIVRRIVVYTYHEKIAIRWQISQNVTKIWAMMDADEQYYRVHQHRRFQYQDFILGRTIIRTLRPGLTEIRTKK